MTTAQPAEPLLVVGVGTSTSSAVLVEGATTLVREPSSNRWSWPSAVCVDDHTVLVGTPAEHLRRVDPAAYRSEFRRDLGDPAAIQLGGKSFRPEELVTELLVVCGVLAALLCCAVPAIGILEGMRPSVARRAVWLVLPVSMLLPVGLTVLLAPVVRKKAGA